MLHDEGGAPRQVFRPGGAASGSVGGGAWGSAGRWASFRYSLLSGVTIGKIPFPPMISSAPRSNRCLTLLADSGMVGITSSKGQPDSAADREEPIVGQKTVRFSDLSGQLITEEDTLARVVVLEHPELGDSPVEFEALADEALAVDQAARRVAVLELHLPGEEEPRRVTVDLDGFDAMATDTVMSELLITARPARRAARSAAAASSRGSRASGSSVAGKVNYSSLEHAG